MIQIKKGDKSLETKFFLFPAGEVGFRVNTNDLLYRSMDAPIQYPDRKSYQTIIARIQNSNDVMNLVMAKDALERFDKTPIHLVMPYVPYARQDRVCSAGDSFSLKAFAQVINGLGFHKVTVFDPHSDVTAAVFDRVSVLSQFDVINRYQKFTERVLKGVVFVSPDAGANKKTSELAKYFGHDHFIRADKLRNLATGEIKETIVYSDGLNGQDVVIADDLCDGGRTFTELAKVLKTKGAGKIILYVTHGLFTKGTKVLFENDIDEIYTTNSYYNVFPAGISDAVNVLNLEEAFKL